MKPDPDKHCTYASLSSSRQRTGGIKYESIDWALDSSSRLVKVKRRQVPLGNFRGTGYFFEPTKWGVISRAAE